LDLELAIADRAGDPSAGADQQPPPHHQLAFEAAAYLGIVDRGGALEEAALGDLDFVAVLQVRLDAALDDELVAGGDLARQRDLAAADQPAQIGVVAAPPLLRGD